MAASVTHAKVSTVPDSADTDDVRMSDWNDEHTVSISAADVGAEASGAVATHAAAADPHTGYVQESLLFDSTVPSNNGTASAGSGTAAAHANHVHPGLATDTFWVAKGDLVVASANDAAAVLGVGTGFQELRGDATNGLSWQADPMQYDLPTGALAQTIPRFYGFTTGNITVPSASGTMYLCPIFLPKGLVVTSISFRSATTAANTPTHWWFALYNSSLVLLKQTADQTNTAWAATTTKTVNLTSSYTTVANGLHYLGIMMTATTIITSLGRTSGVGDAASLAPVLFGTSTTGLTTTAPDPAAAVTFSANGIPYAYVS